MKRNSAHATWKTAFCVALVLAVMQSSQKDVAEAAPPARATRIRAVEAFLLDLDFSRSSKWIATTGHAVRVFNTQSGKLVSTYSSAPLTRCVRFSPVDDERFATTDNAGYVRIFKVGEAEPKTVIKAHPEHDISGLAYSPDGKHFATSSKKLAYGRPAEGQFKVWDSKTGKELFGKTVAAVGCNAVAFSADGASLAVAMTPRGETKSAVEIYNTKDWKLKDTIEFSPGFALSMAFSPNGKMLVIAGGECEDQKANSCKPTGKIWFAELGSDEPPFMVRPDPRQGYFRSVCFSQSGRSFVTGTSHDRGQLQSRDTRSGEVLWMTGGIGRHAYGARLSPDGILAAYCVTGHVHLVDAETGEPVYDIKVTQ